MLTCHYRVSFVSFLSLTFCHGICDTMEKSKNISAQNWATSSSFKMNSFAQPTATGESSQLLASNQMEMRPMNGQSINHGPQVLPNGPNPPHSPINGPHNPNSMNLQSHRPSIQMHSMNNPPRASPRTIQ